MNYLGVDIGGTDVKLGIVDDNGKILLSSKYSVSFDEYETPILNTVIKSIKIFLDSNKISLEKLKGIGVSATGQIDIIEGKVIGTGGHIKNYCGAEIKKEMENTFHLPCTVMNDANCMLLGEVWTGAAKGYKNVIAYTIGTGIGGGILVDGNLLLGKKGLAGEIGHFTIKKDGIQCSCGNKGCFERYASTSALVKRIKELNLDEFKSSEVNGFNIFEQVKMGNETIIPIFNEWIDDIAVGTISLLHIFNPELVVIGGGVSNQKKYLIDPLVKVIKQKAMPCFSEDVEIKKAELGNLAGLIGAVYNFILNIE